MNLAVNKQCDRYWRHPEKARYYRLFLHQDLWGQWMLTQSWGSLLSHQGGLKHIPCEHYEQGYLLFQKITKTRRRRGYRPYPSQLSFDF